MLGELRRVIGLAHPRGEGAVGTFQDAGKPQARPHLRGVLAVHDQRFRARHAVLGEHLRLEDLVRAPHDRLGVVDHDQPLRLRPPGEAVGVVVDARRLPDEQRVVLRQAPVVLLADLPHADAQLPAHPREAGQGALVGGWVWLVGVHQDRQVVARALGVGDAGAREEPLCLFQHERLVGVRNVAGRYGPQRVQSPLVRAHEFGAHQRRGEVGEQRLTEPVVALGQVPAEVDAELELPRADRREGALEQPLEVLRHDAQERRLAQVLDRRHRGQRLVATRRGEERHVVPQRLVAVAAAEVEDLRALHRHETRVGQVVPGRHDLGARHVQRPELRVLDDDQDRHRPAASSRVVRTSRLAS